MDWFATIKKYYPKHWSKSMVGDAVVAGKITSEQYQQITGDEYVTETA